MYFVSAAALTPGMWGHFPFSTNTSFWKMKLEKNVQRDEEHKLRLEKLGWQVFLCFCYVVFSLKKMIMKQ